MSLPNSYTMKVGAIPDYFEAILNAEAPERFSMKFLEKLGFTSTNDRLLIGILRDLAFLNSDSVPQQRYFEFLDRSQSKQVVAQAVREAYAELFAVNKKANEMSVDDVKNKLRTLYSGKKTDLVINNIAKTFVALCEWADFSALEQAPPPTQKDDKDNKQAEDSNSDEPKIPVVEREDRTRPSLRMESLQYHINIVLPDSRDPAVYDAIFRSLRDHLR